MKEQEEERNEYWFKGIWIPLELFANQELSYSEMVLFCLIELLDNGRRGCFASNAYLAARLRDCSTQTVSNGIVKLEQLGYIIIKNRQSTYRTIKVNTTYKATHEPLIRKFISNLKENLYPNKIRVNKEEPSFKEKEGGSPQDFPSPLELGTPSGKEYSEREISRKDRDLLEIESLSRTVAARRRPTKPPEPRTTSGKQLDYRRATPEARSIVDTWNNQPQTPTHSTTTKLIKRTLYHIDYVLLNKYDISKINGVIGEFCEMLENPKTYKVPTKCPSIQDFFMGNEYLSRINGGKQVTPWFEMLVEPGSYIRFARRDDPNVRLTELVKKKYEDTILCESPDYSPKEESQFRQTSVMLSRYMDKGRLEKYIEGNGNMREEYVMALLKALAAEWSADRVTVGHLCSKFTWNSVLPRWLSRQYELPDTVPEDDEDGY